MRVADGQQRRDGIVEIAYTNLGMKSCSCEFTRKLFEFLEADVRIETGADDPVHRGRNRTDDGVIDAVLNESFDDIQ